VRRAADAREALWQHPEFPKLHKKVSKAADIRDQQEDIKHVAKPLKYETGYTQFQKAEALTRQRLLNTMLDLYTLYSHTEDAIVAVTGITQNTAHSGKGKHRRKT
jgi:hypothetical protein